jgi:hypothetical protein
MTKYELAQRLAERIDLFTWFIALAVFVLLLAISSGRDR